MILSNGQYLLPSSMNYIMMDEMIVCKVYINTEEEELDTKDSKFAYGTIIGYRDSEEIEYLVEPIDYRIDVVDKYIEGHSVTWAADPVEFCDKRPENLRMIAEREDRKTKMP